MRAREVMTTSVATVGPNATVKEAATLLVEKAVSALPVIDDLGRLVGIVSEADLIALETEPDPMSHILPAPDPVDPVPKTVREVMTEDVIATDEEADVSLVARLMLDHGVKSIPVVMGTRLLGIVSRRDVLRVLARTDREIKVELDDRLEDAAEVVGGVRAEVRDGVVTIDGVTDDRTRHLARLLARSVRGVIDVRFDDPSSSPPAT
jgi:CBS domain-containing protein